MAGDYTQFQFGGAQFPLVNATTNSLLQDADPSVFFALQYFESVLNTYLGARFTAEAQRSPVITTPDGIPGIVQLTSSQDPANYLTQLQGHFPLLAIYRSKEKYQWKTLTYVDGASSWFVEYVLPPMTAGQLERMGPILNAVKAVILDRIENMFDPSFESGLEVWKAAGLEEISLDESSFGIMPTAGNLIFPSWMGKLTVKERQNPVLSQFEKLTGLDNEIDLASPHDPTIQNFINTVETFLDPTTIPNVAAIYTADVGLSYAPNGSNVAGWTDQSTVAANLAGATNFQPIERPRTFNVLQNATFTPKSAVRFDGSASVLTATDAALAVDTGVTLVVFCRLDNTALRQSLILRSLTSDIGPHTMGPEANTVGSAGTRFGVYAGGSSFDATTGTDQQWHIHILRVSSTTNGTAIAGTVNYRIDGAKQSLTLKSGSGNWQGMSTSTLLALGGNPADMIDTAFSGDIAIAVSVSRSLTDAECASIESYCRLWAGMPQP